MAKPTCKRSTKLKKALLLLVLLPLLLILLTACKDDEKNASYGSMAGNAKQPISLL